METPRNSGLLALTFRLGGDHPHRKVRLDLPLDLPLPEGRSCGHPQASPRVLPSLVHLFPGWAPRRVVLTALTEWADARFPSLSGSSEGFAAASSPSGRKRRPRRRRPPVGEIH